MNQEFQQYQYAEQYYPQQYYQGPPPPPEGPYPGMTHDDFNKLNINEQREFQKFLKDVAWYYAKSMPKYQKEMEEFLSKNLSYNMSAEEHYLMDQYLAAQQEIKAYEAYLKSLEGVQETVELPKEQTVEAPKVEPPKVEAPVDPNAPKPKKKLTLGSKPFNFEAPKPPAMPIFPKHPASIDINKFTSLYCLFINYFQPQAEADYVKFPTPEEEKRKQDKEAEKKKRKEDEIKRAIEKREAAQQNAQKPKATTVVEKKVELDNLEIDLSVFVDPDESRQPVNLVLIGHVDAGKSTLCGRLLLDLGEVSEADIKKFEQDAVQNNRESWWLAYVMDINEDERAKGKTVECGKAQFLTKTKRFSLADAPGHKNYVPNMIQGACQADLAGLIISAKQGEFESGFEKGGQTQEHALLAKSLGVSQLMIIVTKMDTIEWDQQRFNLIVAAVTEFATKQCHFEQIHIIPIDALSGQNISKPLDKAICSWYTGTYLIDAIDTINIPRQNHEGPIRIPIMDKFKDQGALYVYGKLESGQIVDGLECSVYPKRTPFTIAGIYNHKDQRMKYAKAGENIKIKLKGIEEEELKRGMIICNLQSQPCQISTEFQARIRLIELPDHCRILSTGYQCIMHLHSLVEEVEILVEAVIDPETKNPIKQNFLKSMQEGIVRISTKTPVCLEKFDVISTLGRFALRAEGKSIGFGEVLKIKPFKQM